MSFRDLLDRMAAMTVLTGWCSDELHEVCPGHMAGAPCVCACHEDEQ